MRYANQTGRMVPASVCKVWPAWWPWRSSKGKLFHDERCRRGVRLLPLDGPAEDLRKEVAFYREGVPDVDHPNAAELGTTVVLGRTTRAFDNRQGIQDPRVSRRHALLTFLRHDPNHANGIVRMHALGHNPSTVKRANKTMPGELSSFKLRRGEATTLYPGDVVQFVCEDVFRELRCSQDADSVPQVACERCDRWLRITPEYCKVVDDVYDGQEWFCELVGGLRCEPNSRSPFHFDSTEGRRNGECMIRASYRKQYVKSTKRTT